MEQVEASNRGIDASVKEQRDMSYRDDSHPLCSFWDIFPLSRSLSAWSCGEMQVNTFAEHAHSRYDSNQSAGDTDL